MKKILVVFALFSAMVFMISCGGGSSSDNNSVTNFGKLGKECYPNKTCDEGLTCDTDNNICIEDPENPVNDSDKTDSGRDGEADTGSDFDGGDSASDNGDTTPDGGDTAPDNGDTTPDNGDTGNTEPDDDTGDTEPDSGDKEPDNDADSTTEQSDEDTDSDSDLLFGFPTCSPDSGTPCIYNLLLLWSAKSSEQMRWSEAVEYCQDLTEGGYDDWRLPDITLLYTLLQNCEYPQYMNEACLGGDKPNGEYSPFGEIGFLWSSTTYGTSQAWGIYFHNGAAQNKNVDERFNVRCVRIATTSVNTECTEIPENAVYNTISEITLTWSWETYWAPGNETTYNEEPSTEECRFKCKENYLFDPDSGKCLNPCNPNPCNTHSTECIARSAKDYVCKCDEGYYWWGQETGCTDKLTIGNICTNQTLCYYYVSGVMENCPNLSTDAFYGQDAQNIDKCTPQDFTQDTSKGIVTDNNTGLIWEISPSNDNYTWENAGNHCADLNNSNYGGINTWRIPNPLEFMTVVDNSGSNPAINLNFIEMPTLDTNYFWTSKEYKYNTSYAYLFSPSYGWCKSKSSDLYLKTNTYKVICVSGNEMQPAVSSDFTISSDGKTVTDLRTGLIWNKEYAAEATWEQALAYCQTLNSETVTGWRLPNKNELTSLVNYEKSEQPYSYFPDMPKKSFWSSSTYIDKDHDYYNAWSVDFNYGHTTDIYSKGSNLSVRCVR